MAAIVPALRLVFAQRGYVAGGIVVALATAALYAYSGQVVTVFADGTVFVDPDPHQIEKAKLLRAGAVEIQPARYAEARKVPDQKRQLAALHDAATFTRGQGLHLHMGHGLTYTNVQPLPLAWGQAPPLLAFLRHLPLPHLPLLKLMIPSPQVLHSGVAAVYRIQLQPTACVLSASPPCYGALLLDAIAPDNATDWIRIGA